MITSDAPSLQALGFGRENVVLGQYLEGLVPNNDCIAAKEKKSRCDCRQDQVTDHVTGFLPNTLVDHPELSFRPSEDVLSRLPAGRSPAGMQRPQRKADEHSHRIERTSFLPRRNKPQNCSKCDASEFAGNDEQEGGPSRLSITSATGV